MATKIRWITVLAMTILVLLVGVFPAAAFPGLPPAAPMGPHEARPLAWGSGAAVPTAGWLMSGASVDGCTFYAVGGNTPGSVAVPNVDLYNPATDAWTSRAPMPMGLYGIQPSAVGTRIYVVGGYADISTGLYAMTSTLIYDSGANSWSSGAPIPVGDLGIGTAAQATHNGKVYVMGGDDGDYNSNSTNYEYTIATDSWTLRASMPTARENNVAVTLNGKIYVAGGAQGADPNYAGMTAFEAYDPATDSWATLAPMQVARVSPGIATDGAYVYIYGGADSLGATFSTLDSRGHGQRLRRGPDLGGRWPQFRRRRLHPHLHQSIPGRRREQLSAHGRAVGEPRWPVRPAPRAASMAAGAAGGRGRSAGRTPHRAQPLVASGLVPRR